MDEIEKTTGQLATYLSGMDPRMLYAFVGIGIILLLIAIVAGLRGRRGAQPQLEPVMEAFERTMPPPAGSPPESPLWKNAGDVDRQIAEMTETSQLTGFGSFCVLMMLLTWIISIFVFLSAKGALQEVVGLLIWIGGNTMFGVGALISRQRKYRIYQP